MASSVAHNSCTPIDGTGDSFISERITHYPTCKIELNGKSSSNTERKEDLEIIFLLVLLVSIVIYIINYFYPVVDSENVSIIVMIALALLICYKHGNVIRKYFVPPFIPYNRIKTDYISNVIITYINEIVDKIIIPRIIRELGERGYPIENIEYPVEDCPL
ncbi:uncharacterized protein RJT21DRAFT_113853 [Scheffersomyces amazonensis]|uniref:uncharacterized protein n=1 Tax=Scheffersomyces amazonensis TaxID=1078765 RepID=UPI00315CF440